jgi:hypothetical protein
METLTECRALEHPGGSGPAPQREMRRVKLILFVSTVCVALGLAAIADIVISQGRAAIYLQNDLQILDLPNTLEADSNDPITESPDTLASDMNGDTAKLPSTLVADFNGATAEVVVFPAELQKPSGLDLYGFEIKGTFTARSSGSYGVKYIAIHGVLNHPIQCELRGYRVLTREFAGIA